MALYDSLCITTVNATIMSLAGVEIPSTVESPNLLVTSLAALRLGDKPVDRVVIYNPDAVALWLYQKYTERFADAAIRSDLALPMLSVMPSVTPVCFASMYTGVMPKEHGILSYTKPVLKIDTIFDAFVKAGKKPAIVSTSGDSISRIFLEREMDYFIYDTEEAVNQKALELIDEDRHDLIVIYNGSYDATMHRYGPESEIALQVLAQNVAFYAQLADKIHKDWEKHNVFYGFCPDHGCHEIDGDLGSHGLHMEEDMNVVHFYGIKPAKLILQ